MAPRRYRPVGCVKRVTGRKAGVNQLFPAVYYHQADLIEERVQSIREEFPAAKFYVNEKWIVARNAKERRDFFETHGVDPAVHRVDYMTTAVEAVREARRQLRAQVPTPDFVIFLVKVEPTPGAARNQHAILYVSRYRPVDPAQMQWWERQPNVDPQDPYNTVAQCRASVPPIRFGSNIYPAQAVQQGIFFETLANRLHHAVYDGFGICSENAF